MTRCISERCEREVDPAWAFCPHCGADNRPPETRFPIVDCPHNSLMVDRYCVDCGSDLAPQPTFSYTPIRDEMTYNSDDDGVEDLTSSRSGLANTTWGCWTLPIACIGLAAISLLTAH